MYQEDDEYDKNARFWNGYLLMVHFMGGVWGKQKTFYIKFPTNVVITG